MKFTDCNMIADIYQDMISGKGNYNFEEVEKMIAEFDSILLGLDADLRASQLDKVHSEALCLGSAMEMQGFIYGFKAGLSLQKELNNLD